MRERESERRRRFDALFASYSRDLVAYCGWRAGSTSDAEDAVAEVFLTAWRRLDELPEGDAARGWLYATARRVIANQRRSTRRRVALHERLVAEAGSAPPEPPSLDREGTLVHEALRYLRPRDREGLLLAEWEGLSPAEIVRITHDGRLWAGKTVCWNGADVAIADDAPTRAGRLGKELRVVDGTLYGPDADGGWLMLGNPKNIDPDSGTTPGEHLAAVREDIGGVTLRRITNGVSGLTTSQLDDGSAVYRGTVAAGLIARESGFKEGQPIRVLPFGYVAHDEAADPAAPLDAAVTVGADGIVREIAVTWGTNPSAWRYTVTYLDLGATPAPVAPENARPLRHRSTVGEPPAALGESK